MKLNRLQWDVLSYAVESIGNALEMRINAMNDRLEARKNGESLKWGVNWGAHGTQDAEYTLDFAERLQKAARTAQLLTSLEITYSYSDEPVIGYEDFQRYAKALMNMIELDMPEMVVEILNKLA